MKHPMKPLTIVVLSVLSSVLLYAQAVTGGLTSKGPVDSTSATSTAPIKSGTSLPGTCSVGQLFFKTDAANTGVLYACTATNTFTQQTGIPGAHSFTCNIGSATSSTVIATGDTGCYSDTGTLSGNITGATITGNAAALATCSITVDIWKANAAYPTSGNKISASAPVTLSSAHTNDAGSVGTWTLPVAAHDRWGASVASVTGCVYATLRVEFQ